MAALLLGLLPRSIADRIYDWVATNRYKWFGKRPTLCVPRPQGDVRGVVRKTRDRPPSLVFYWSNQPGEL
jgi:hypothetical protein